MCFGAAFCRDYVSCRDGVMHAAIFVADVAETQGVHLAAELQSCRTDELIDKRELNSLTRIFENCKARNDH